MSNSQNQINNFSAVEKSLNWIGDKLLDIKNYVEVDLATQQFIDGMNVNQNYKVIYERQNNGANSEWSVKLASKAGAIVQAYTGPSLYYTVGKLTQGLSNIFGDSVSKGMDVLIGNIDSNNSMLAAYARVGEVAGNSVANGLGKVFGFFESNGRLSFDSNKDIFLSLPSNSSGSNSVIIKENINSSTGKSSVSVSSSDYSKSELKTSSQQVLKTQSVGTKVEIEGSDGVVNGTLLNNSLIEEFNKVVNTEIKFDDNFKISDNLYLAEDSAVVLKDGTISNINEVLDVINSAQATAEVFINNYMYQLTSIFTTGSGLAGLISDVNAGIENGDSAEQIGKTVALKALVQTVGQQIKNAFILSDADWNLFNSNPSLAMKSDVLGYAVKENGVMSQEGQDALNKFANNHPVYNAVYMMAVSMATTMLLNADEDWDSQEYTVAAAQVTAQVSAQIAVSVAAEKGWFGKGIGGSAAGAGVGAAAAYIISSGVNDLFADDHMNSHQWQSTFVSAGVLGVAAYAGYAAAAYLIGGSIAGPIGAIVAGIIVSQFMGGKEYKAGEYPDPYSYLQVIAKEDGTGNKIIGVEPEGVVAIAREGYNDDLYGNSGDDNLIGKSGKNVIFGYGGNDHLEGRGEADLLIAGDGDDEVFGGNGDDQIYGGAGADMLFGGNGNDIIIGGTGDSISGTNSGVDGADFIKGGNGDDQIMGEAGNDIIFGDAGNDIILGGLGSDVIEGNDGDDSILGEDGDDIIIGGAGSDIIDGGAGVDYIDGGEGNDNVRGGDGDDEIYGAMGVDIIYGDAGNDLVNAGGENDLVFGGLGNDIIYGSLGDDTLSGEFGNDYLIGAEGNDTIDGGIGDDILFGGIGNDTITTGEGNDTIIYRAGDGEDVIKESEANGNDVLRLVEINSKLSNSSIDKVVLTKSGSDLVIQFRNDANIIIAGDKITVKDQFLNAVGNEVLKKIEFADGKAIDLTKITINSDNSVSYTTAIYKNIDTSIQEELMLGYNDQMQVLDEKENPDSTYNANNYNSSGEQENIDSEKYNEVEWRSYKKKRNVFGGHYNVWYKYYEKNLNGTDGNDRIVGHWWSENLYGGNGDDQLNGGSGNDNLYGGEGNDILHGGTGNDNIYGGNGQDLIYGGTGNDNILGENDNDTIYGNSDNDKINGGLGDDYIEGNEGDDQITDNDGNNILIAGAGSDIVNAGAGNDKIEGNDDADIINAGAGNNLIYGNGGNDSITTGAGNDTIYGQEGFDLINAGGGDDYISGGAGDDKINGEDGADTIYGDLGIDQISGGAGNDYIYGGSGADILKGDAGNDQIKGGDSDDYIEGGIGDDKLYGQSGSDIIYGDAGNDYIDGGIEGDVLEGGDGDDTIIGGLGNDILVDGAGSDILDGGTDSDIIILTTEIDDKGNTKNSNSVDIVKNFNKDEDKIILKVSYKNPFSFADIERNMIQNNENVEISLSNGQKIIIEDVTISEITAKNFQIGLSGGANNDILFGTSGEDIIFGDAGNDKIYGGDGDDELWGGKGSDELYGQGGNDILRYEADGKYARKENTIFSDEIGRYWGYSHRYVHKKHYFNDAYEYYTYKPNNGYASNNYNQSNDVVIRGYDYLNRGEISRQEISIESSRVKNEPYRSSWYYGIVSVQKVNFSYEQTAYFSTKNFYNSQLTDITGYNRTFDKFIGGSGVNTILMTEGNDVLALDDATSASGSQAAGTATTARVQDISVIHAGKGNDVINFSTQKYSYGDVVVYGGEGDDKIWLSSGNDVVFGGEGNDEIFGGAGNDRLVGGAGNNFIYGGLGNDTLEGSDGVNSLYGHEGDDLFIAGSGIDKIIGGYGSDTISYANSDQMIKIDLRTFVDEAIESGKSVSEKYLDLTINSENLISKSENGASSSPSKILIFYAQEAKGGYAENDEINSIENVIGTAFEDQIIGNFQSNILNGGSGNDILQGGLGSDTYVYNANSGTDTIYEFGNDIDYIEFRDSISQSDLSFKKNGDDMEIQVGSDINNKLILKGQYLSGGKIETLKFKDGSQIQIAGNIANQGSNAAYASTFYLQSNSTSTNNNTITKIIGDTSIVNEDQNLIIDNFVLANLVDQNNLLQISALNGSVSFDSVSKKFNYIPNKDFSGNDTLTITYKTGQQEIRTIVINQVNDAPTISDINLSVQEDSSLTISLAEILQNAYDVEDGTKIKNISINDIIFNNPQNGEITIDQNSKTLIYTPNSNYSGADAISYQIKDSKLASSNFAKINININQVNDAPIVNSSFVSLNKNHTSTIKISDILANAYDYEDQDLIRKTSISNIRFNEFLNSEKIFNNNGTYYYQSETAKITIDEANNSLIYQPNQNYSGNQKLSYQVKDSNGVFSNVSAINLNVTSFNNAPTNALTISDLTTNQESEDVLINAETINSAFSDIDGDVLNYSATLSNGTQIPSWLIIDNATGEVKSLKPSNDDVGNYELIITATDSSGAFASQKFGLIVNNINDTPTASVVSEVTDEDNVKIIDVLSDASDVDGDILTISAITQGNNGVAEIFVDVDGKQKIKYTPNANFNGNDSITYTISDSNGGLVTQSLNIVVNSINDNPTASVVSEVTDEDNVKIIDVLSGAADIDGDTLTISAITQGTNGITQIFTDIDGKQKIKYTPNANFNGNDSFNYTMSDGKGGLVTKTLNIVVNSINDNPTASIELSTTNEDKVKIIDVLSKSYDIDGDILTISAITQGTNGVVEIFVDVDGKQKIKYIPNANFNGNDSFNYTISDGKGGLTTKTLNIKVNPVNDAPVIDNISFVTEEDSVFNIKLSDILANASDIEDGILIKNLSLNDIIFSNPSRGSLIKNDDGSLSYIANKNYNGNDSFTYQIKDSNGVLSNKAKINLVIKSVNDSVTIGSALTDQNVKAGNNFKYVISSKSFIDIDKDVLSYSAKLADDSELPRWLKFDSLTKTFSGNIPSGIADNLLIKVIASDGFTSASQVFALNIASNVINGTFSADNLTGTLQNDEIYGDLGNDVIYGRNGNDVIYGNDGKDKIRGDAGDDIIIGGKDNDTISGGSGSDIFKYISLNDSIINSSDLITDFTKGEDKIDLSALDFDSIIRKDNISLTQENEQLDYYFNAKNQTIIENKEKSFAIILNNKIELDDGDFIF